MSEIHYQVKRITDMTDNEIAECAALFSNNYGLYRKDSPRNAGNRIRMSPSFFREKYFHEDVHLAMAKAGRHVIGQAVYIRKKYNDIGTVTWVLQLVVSEKHRKKGIGSRLLYSIWGMSDDFAWGLATANPCTVKALENATFRRCDPKYIQKNLNVIGKLAEETGFAGADQFYVEDGRSQVNSGFYVDNSDYMKAYRSIRDWKLGELSPGYEWLAFTFRDQPIDEEKRKKHFENLLEFSEERLTKAYSRMKIGSHAWSKGTVNEVDHILSQINPGSNMRVLDVGCAIGRHAFEVYKRGYSVKGIDLSGTHIHEAQRKLKRMKKQRKNSIEFEIADIRSNPGREKYDLVLALYDVIGSYPEASENRMMLSRITRRVKAGGYLALSVMNMELTRSMAIPAHIGDVKNHLQMLYKLKPSFTMQETGNVFQPDYYVIDEKDHVVYRKEQFGNDRELPAEDIIRDYRYTMDEIRGLVENEGFDVIDARYVQAGHFDQELTATDPTAKEILIIARKIG